MDSFEISIRKTEGGIGSDAWTALFETRNGLSIVKAVQRGSSRTDARAKLKFELLELNRQICAAVDELSETGQTEKVLREGE